MCSMVMYDVIAVCMLIDVFHKIVRTESVLCCAAKWYTCPPGQRPEYSDFVEPFQIAVQMKIQISIQRWACNNMDFMG